jgi:hypothetical protein
VKIPIIQTSLNERPLHRKVAAASEKEDTTIRGVHEFHQTANLKYYIPDFWIPGTPKFFIRRKNDMSDRGIWLIPGRIAEGLAVWKSFGVEGLIRY